MENRRNTFDVNEEVSKCESLAELQEILSRNSNYYYVWKIILIIWSKKII